MIQSRDHLRLLPAITRRLYGLTAPIYPAVQFGDQTGVHFRRFRRPLILVPESPSKFLIYTKVGLAWFDLCAHFHSQKAKHWSPYEKVLRGMGTSICWMGTVGDFDQFRILEEFRREREIDTTMQTDSAFLHAATCTLLLRAAEIAAEFWPAKTFESGVQDAHTILQQSDEAFRTTVQAAFVHFANLGHLRLGPP